MTDKIILRDNQVVKDKLAKAGHSTEQIIRQLKGGVTRTRILMVDHDTGEILDEIKNKVLVTGAQDTACKQFGLDPVLYLPTYNSELGLENSFPDWSEQPWNTPITCLWCCGQSGFLSSPGEIIAVDTKDRIEPVNDILPFRYCGAADDLDNDQRQVYFGRKVFDDDMIGYYFKKFDSEPQLHIRYLDGTEVGSNMYSVKTPQDIEVFVEMRLSISRMDFRDYFDQVLGWGNAHINTVSLCTAWYRNDIVNNPGAELEDVTRFQWFQDIVPFTKFNFKDNDLSELNKAVDFIYQIYY